MKKIITFILLVLGSTNLFGQNNTNGKIPLPPPYIITSDTSASYISLPDSCWQMIADPSGKLALQQVLQSENFRDTIRKINHDINTYWVRYRFINKMSKEVTLALPESAASVDFYIKSGDDGKWEHQLTGKAIPWSKRDGLKRITTITKVIPPEGQLLIYKKVYWNYTISHPERMKVDFAFASKIIQKNYINNQALNIQSFLETFLLGFGLLAFIFYLYFYIVVREKEFLYFSLFVFFALLNTAARIPDILFTEHPLAPNYLILFSASFIYFFTIHFIRSFLKTFALFPRWDKYLIVQSFSPAIVYIYTMFSPAVFPNVPEALNIFLSLGVTLIFNMSVLFTLALYIHKRDLMTRLVIVAMVPIFVFDTVNLALTAINYIYFFGFNTSSAPSSILSAAKIFWVLFIIANVWMIVVLAGILFRRFSLLRKKVALQEVEREKERSAFIEQQKTELEKQVTERTSELKQSLDNLKSTQSQLIQFEKMASLGELTAGIAHEIQNPLNFVNNFSEVNKELLEELKEEAGNGNLEEVKSIAEDVIANEEKRNHHGKRADAIVKGMLEHSRTSTGVKEPADINKLADEYLRLAYHGMRAKDKSFNCTIETHFDESLQKINVVPQDIGRVLLNLFNNAFYACAERSRSTCAERSRASAGSADGYVPTVTVSTMYSPLPGRGVGGEAIITVKDNGNGISEKIKDKIFQPFFTTKPTGQGTGLGLSLSYDIITKEHNGTIKVESEEGEGTEFIIRLPVN